MLKLPNTNVHELCYNTNQRYAKRTRLTKYVIVKQLVAVCSHLLYYSCNFSSVRGTRNALSLAVIHRTWCSNLTNNQKFCLPSILVVPADREKDRPSQGGKTQSTATTRKREKVVDISVHPKYASERPESLMPEHVAENAARMIKAGITEDELGTAEHPRLSFWDFGGQATYYGTHHCFITHRGVYILVMSLLQKLSDPVPDLDYMASVDNLRSGGDYLDHWLNTVHSHTQSHTGRPPVIIVLTRKDKVSEEYIEKYKEEIRSHIKEKAAGPLVMPEIFAVDNTTEDATVDEIRDYIRQVASGLPHMGERIPIPWLHLNSKLKTKRKEGDRFCKFQEIADLARDPDISITDRHSLALVLTFLHDRGDVIFFNEPSLRDDVTLQPQVMIDVFKTIITIPQYQEDRQTNPEVRKMWRRLEQEGVLSDELLTRIWEKKDRQLEKPLLMRHKSFLKVLMEKFYLLCNATPVGDVSDEAQQEEIYFVPALLSCERDNAKLYPGNMYICPQALYFVFSERFLPSGMFCRLQALCVRRFGLRESCVFAGCAHFPTDDEKQAFVITKVDHYLKVELLSSSNVFTEGLRVRKFLSSALFEIKEKWIPCIQYELCCATREDGGEPDFLALQTDDGSVEQDSGIPSAFRVIWMNGSSKSHRTENSGGDGPVIIEPTADPRSIVGMRTIGPVLDTMEQGGGLTLDQCDLTRSQLTPAERVRDMVKMVENRYQLGAAVEMCCPEFVDLFLREKRGKELVILHTGDYTDKFVLPLQTAALDAGVPCHTETITSADSITEKTVEHLLNTNNRMAILVITPDALDQKHWSHLDYEFPVRNEKLLLPILLYPMQDKNKERMVRVLQQRSPVLANMERVEIQMEGREVSETKLQEIIQKKFNFQTDRKHTVPNIRHLSYLSSSVDFRLVLESIFSRLDETDVRLLLRAWSARTSQDDIPEIKTPQDLKRAMEKTGCFRTGDLGVLEKDMMAAGISFPLIMRDIPGVPDEFQYPRTREASVGPAGGEVEIPGFVKLVVPPGALQQETMITVSTVDVPGILRGPEGVNWISGYPWSLGKDACPRELLDQVLFSPAVDVNLHGAQLSGPVELETWRPSGSEGMGCLLLKHHDGEGWTDITASTIHHIHPDRISISLQTFSPLDIVWAPVDLAIRAGKWMVDALCSRTLNCSFAAYVEPDVEDAEFHVVCRDQSVETEEYLQNFCRCGKNDARFDLYHGDKIHVAVDVHGGQTKTEAMELRATHCCDGNGQNVQMLLDRPRGKRLKGEVVVRTTQERTVCQFVFKERGNAIPSASVRPAAAEDIDSGVLVSEGADGESHQGPTLELVDVQEEHFDDVIKEASARWDDLARKLGFNKNTIDVIRDLKPDQDSRCREMLERWSNREGREATLQALQQALIDIGETRTAQNLGGL
ncbi:uncharacterized protein [Branchiostoma lanceolatum]|uniref:uncharacterized protein n=1 Tax=Branchiostoma lanceolatum TaxID=7740 RepID=UPI00345690C2